MVKPRPSRLGLWSLDHTVHRPADSWTRSQMASSTSLSRSAYVIYFPSKSYVKNSSMHRGASEWKIKSLGQDSRLVN